LVIVDTVKISNKATAETARSIDTPNFLAESAGRADIGTVIRGQALISLKSRQSFAV